MSYAATGYCHDTGEAATLAMNSYRAGLGGNPCPYVWDGSKAVAYSYSTATGLCTVTTTKVTFPTCTEPGPIGPIESPIWSLTPVQGAQIAGAILLVWALAWAIRQIARSLSIDSERSEP